MLLNLQEKSSQKSKEKRNKEAEKMIDEIKRKEKYTTKTETDYVD